MLDYLRSGSCAEADLWEERVKLIQNRVRNWVEEGRSHCIAYVIARDGIVVADHVEGGAQGLDARSDRRPIFGIASATKPISATAALLLVEEGRLSLNRPVKEYLPELRGKGSDKVLMHQLLTHTSGYTVSGSSALRGREVEEAALGTKESGPSLRPLVEAAFDVDVAVEPGSEMAYCGFVNYLLVGEVIERVAGMALPAFARTRIFEPLGMRNTSYGLPPDRAEDRIAFPPGVYDGFDGFDPNDPRRLALPHPAGGAFSTAFDLAIFAHCFLTGGTYDGYRLLSPASVAAMTTNQLSGIGCRNGDGRWVSEASWGLGWGVQGMERWRRSQGILQPAGCYFHQGASGVAMWVDPAHRLSGIFMSVISKMCPSTEEYEWEFDHFQNMVTSAILPRQGGGRSRAIG